MCSYKHLGIILSTTGNSRDKVQEACKKGKASFMSLAGAGVRPHGLNPITCSKLFKLIVLPRSLYGCELWNQLPQFCIQQLERMQRFCAKIAQGFSRRVRSDKVNGMLGLIQIQAFIDKLKLSFFRRLCLMSGNLIAKQIFTFRLSQHVLSPNSAHRGLIPDILTICNKYDLSNLFPMSVISSHIPDKSVWDATIIEKIVHYEYDCFVSRSNSDPDFYYYNQIQDHCFSPSILWEAARNIPGSLPKFSYVARLAVSLDSVQSDSLNSCTLCTGAFYNPIIHVLCCKSSINARNCLMNFISNNCSVHLEAYLVGLSGEQFVCTMFGAPIPDDIIISTDIHYVLLYGFSIYIYSVSKFVNLLLCQPENSLN